MVIEENVKLFGWLHCANIRVTGIYGPGYDERRRERIKQRYGVDVPPAQ